MADTIPWSDPDGTRTPTPRDTALMAAWRTFMSAPRLGNTHDWLWAAIVHGYDTGVAASRGSEQPEVDPLYGDEPWRPESNQTDWQKLPFEKKGT